MVQSHQQSKLTLSAAAVHTTERPTIARPEDPAPKTQPNCVGLDHSWIVGRPPVPGQIVLDHPNVSCHHAMFELAGETVAHAMAAA
jgi:hypothetical protein